MIARPPRSAAELSPRLRAITEHAWDRFEEPDEPVICWPLVRRGIVVRSAVVFTLILGALASKLAIDTWMNRVTTPSAHAFKAAEFLASARACEMEAARLRAIVASGGPGLLYARSSPRSPGAVRKLAPGLAAAEDRQASTYRRLANQEIREDLGLSTH